MHDATDRRTTPRAENAKHSLNLSPATFADPTGSSLHLRLPDPTQGRLTDDHRHQITSFRLHHPSPVIQVLRDLLRALVLPRNHDDRLSRAVRPCWADVLGRYILDDRRIRQQHALGALRTGRVVPKLLPVVCPPLEMPRGGRSVSGRLANLHDDIAEVEGPVERKAFGAVDSSASGGAVWCWRGSVGGRCAVRSRRGVRTETCTRCRSGQGRARRGRRKRRWGGERCRCAVWSRC